jgi:hypothetical protein
MEEVKAGFLDGCFIFALENLLKRNIESAKNAD